MITEEVWTLCERATMLCYVTPFLVSSRSPIKHWTKQGRQFKYNVTLRHVRVMFIPPRLSLQPGNLSHENNVLWRLNVAGSNKTYFGKVSDFNQILSFSTYIRRSLKHQISRKSFQWEPRWYMSTDGQTDMTNVSGASRDGANAPKTAKGLNGTRNGVANTAMDSVLR